MLWVGKDLKDHLAPRKPGKKMSVFAKKASQESKPGVFKGSSVPILDLLSFIFLSFSLQSIHSIL